MEQALAGAALTWSEELATGVPTLDEQHQALFHCVAELERATIEGTMLSTFHALGQLRRYTLEHFREEERLMRLANYPDIDTHIAEHRDFSQRLFELGRSFLDHDLSAELIMLLHDWLARHVVDTDMGYVPYLAVRRAIACGSKAELGASA